MITLTQSTVYLFSLVKQALVKGESITRLYEMDQELHLNLF